MATVPPPARVLCHSSASQQCPKPGVGQRAKQVQGRRVSGMGWRRGAQAPGHQVRRCGMRLQDTLSSDIE